MDLAWIHRRTIIMEVPCGSRPSICPCFSLGGFTFSGLVRALCRQDPGDDKAFIRQDNNL